MTSPISPVAESENETVLRQDRHLCRKPLEQSRELTSAKVELSQLRETTERVSKQLEELSDKKHFALRRELSDTWQLATSLERGERQYEA